MLSLAIIAALSASPNLQSERTWIFLGQGAFTVPETITPQALNRRKLRGGAAAPNTLGLNRLVRTKLERAGFKIHRVSRWLRAVSVEGKVGVDLNRLPVLSRAVRPVARLSLDGVAQESTPSAETIRRRRYPSMVGALGLQHCGLRGAGIRIGVIDSGFDLEHQAFQYISVVGSRDFIDDDDVVGTELDDPPNQAQHGTRVLSVLAGDDVDFFGVAPDADYLLAKTEDISQEVLAEEDDFVAGLEWLEAQGVDVVSSSVAYVDWYEPEDLDGQTAPVTQAVEAAAALGVLVVQSMGNSGPEPSTLKAPSDAPSALSVGSVDADGTVTLTSARGPTADGRTKPDVVAPGQSVWVVRTETLDSYTVSSGTSFATPLVAGVAALLLEEDPTRTPADVIDLLTGSAIGGGAGDNDYGHGLIDGLGASSECNCADLDDDGQADFRCGGLDCADDDLEIYPGAPERCNGLDDNCDGWLGPGEDDTDGDGAFLCGLDCDDQSAEVSPQAAEVCGDGVDNDCDGDVDGADPDCAETGCRSVTSGLEILSVLLCMGLSARRRRGRRTSLWGRLIV